MFNKIKVIAFVALLIIPCSVLWGQKNFNGPPLFIDVNAIKFDLKKLNGEGQFTTQYSWMLTGEGPEKTEIWFWPQDEWHSQMLYQIFNPICLDDNGVIDQFGQAICLFLNHLQAILHNLAVPARVFPPKCADISLNQRHGGFQLVAYHRNERALQLLRFSKACDITHRGNHIQ